MVPLFVTVTPECEVERCRGGQGWPCRPLFREPPVTEVEPEAEVVQVAPLWTVTVPGPLKVAPFGRHGAGHAQGGSAGDGALDHKGAAQGLGGVDPEGALVLEGARAG